jgi:hypothetical protein
MILNILELLAVLYSSMTNSQQILLAKLAVG